MFRVSDLACRSRRTERAGDVVMMAILPVETYLPDWGFLSFFFFLFVVDFVIH